MRVAIMVAAGLALAGCVQGPQGPLPLAESQNLQCEFQANAASMGAQPGFDRGFARGQLRNQCIALVATQNMEAASRRLGTAFSARVPDAERPRVYRVIGGAAEACQGAPDLPAYRAAIDLRFPFRDGQIAWADGIRRFDGAPEGECAAIRALIWEAVRRPELRGT
jgi:hypothetical protein